jgi:hypothetical protein
MAHPRMFDPDDPLLARVRGRALAPPAPDERPALEADPRVWVPAYLGPAGWLGLDLDERTDLEEVAELLEDSFRLTAPARLVAMLDRRRP